MHKNAPKVAVLDFQHQVQEWNKNTQISTSRHTYRMQGGNMERVAALQLQHDGTQTQQFQQQKKYNDGG